MKKIKLKNFILIATTISLISMGGSLFLNNLQNQNNILQNNKKINIKSLSSPTDDELKEINNIPHFKSNPDEGSEGSGKWDVIKIKYRDNLDVATAFKKILPSDFTALDVEKFLDTITTSNIYKILNKEYNVIENSRNNNKGTITVQIKGTVQQPSNGIKWGFEKTLFLTGLGIDLDNDGTNDFGKNTKNGIITLNESTKDLLKEIYIYDLSFDDN
ncbi:MAG: lipoprotein 17-related variable surface protein, partial [Metamycoplasmataceae bacterium]